MAKLSADRFNNLKARVKAECLRRAYSGSVASYGGTTYDYSVTPATGTVAKQEHRDKIATPLNAINSNTITTASGQKVISESDMVNMEAFTTVLEKRTKTDNSGTDCKTGCTGMCYGCQDTCYNVCTSCTGNCTGSCSGSCDGCCSYDCSSSCDGCSDDCGDTCGDACHEDCGGSCMDDCGLLG